MFTPLNIILTSLIAFLIVIGAIGLMGSHKKS